MKSFQSVFAEHLSDYVQHRRALGFRFALDVLECPRCFGRMRIVNALKDSSGCGGLVVSVVIEST